MLTLEQRHVPPDRGGLTEERGREREDRRRTPVDLTQQPCARWGDDCQEVRGLTALDRRSEETIKPKAPRSVRPAGSRRMVRFDRDRTAPAPSASAARRPPRACASPRSCNRRSTVAWVGSEAPSRKSPPSFSPVRGQILAARSDSSRFSRQRLVEKAGLCRCRAFDVYRALGIGHLEDQSPQGDRNPHIRADREAGAPSGVRGRKRSIATSDPWVVLQYRDMS